MDEMRRMTEGISLIDLSNSSFLHQVCFNENVTLEMVEYLLEFHSQAINTIVDYDFDEVQSAYPLHLACFNDECPNEVIQLLLKRLGDSAAIHLTHICSMYEDWGGTDAGCDEYGGTPLHYYLSRTNVDLDIVKQLVASPEALLLTDDDTKCTPIHILMHNSSIGDMYDVVKYLVETNPSSLQMKDEYNHVPLHAACSNMFITVETIQLLLRACPDSVRQRDDSGRLPMHSLCYCGMNGRGKMNDVLAEDILKHLLDAHPDSARIQIDDEEGDDNLSLHLAANNKSPAFCKLLVDAYPESVKRFNNRESLPFHFACYDGRPDTVEYLFGLYPESLHIRDGLGYLPIHSACNYIKESTPKIIKFLLRHDPECLSKPIVSHFAGDHHRQGNGALPLHIICQRWDKSNVTELLYDLYPEAILMRNGLRNQLPIDIIRERFDYMSNSEIHFHETDHVQRVQDLLPFLYTQTSYATMAQNETAMRRRDRTGSLPLHNAIRSEAPLGSIRLLVNGNQDAINVPDGYGVHPLDIACQFCTVDVVKYLAKLIGNDRLDTCDVNKNYPLHHACRGGNCEVIEYLLERPMSSASVSERNADNMLPIHLFCEFVKGRWCEGETPEYTEMIWRLLTAYPETVLNW